MLGDAAQPLIDRRGYDWPFHAVGAALTGDFVVAVAEAPISTLTLPWNPDKRYSYSTRPEAAGAMARAGIDAVTLANNHAFDVGPRAQPTPSITSRPQASRRSARGLTLARAEQPLLLRTALGHPRHGRGRRELRQPGRRGHAGHRCS